MSDPGLGRGTDRRDSPHPARDRDVLAVAAVVVVGVLALNLLTVVVPALDRLLALAPVVVFVMVAVTAWVLVRSARPGRR